MRLNLNEIRVGDKIRAAFPSGDAYFIYFGEVVSINQHTVELKTFNGCIAVPSSSRLFNDEPAPVYILKAGDE